MAPNSNSENIRKRNNKSNNDYVNHNESKHNYIDKVKNEAKLSEERAKERMKFEKEREREKEKEKESKNKRRNNLKINVHLHNENKYRNNIILRFNKVNKIFILFTIILLSYIFYIINNTINHNHNDKDDKDAKDDEQLKSDQQIDGDYHIFLATAEQHLSQVHLHEVNCSERGYWREKQINAEPSRCGTLIYDELVTEKEAQRLRKLATNLTEEIGDFSGQIRESFNLRWVNLHKAFLKGPQKNILSEKDYQLIKKTGEKAKSLIANIFGIPDELLLFSNVSQFTRYRAVTEFSEFRHVDKVRSPSLIVTSILWLSTVDMDFTGGRTEFLTGEPGPFTPLLIDPKIGRFSAWTSSYENPHSVLEIYDGERVALIFGFTVNSLIGHSSIDNLRHWAITQDEFVIY